MEPLVGEEMGTVLVTIVVSESASKGRRKNAKCFDQSAVDMHSAAAWKQAELGEACFSLENDQQRARRFVIAGGVDFPMTDDAPGVDGRGPMRNGNAKRNAASGVFARNKAAMHAFAMTLGKEGNQLTGTAIDPLINGLVTDGETRPVERKASCDQFRRPAQAQFGSNIITQERRLKPRPGRSGALAEIGTLLSTTGKIAMLVDRRTVAPKLARKRGRTAMKNACDLTDRFTGGA